MSAQERASEVMDTWTLERLAAFPLERLRDLHTRQLLKLKARFAGGLDSYASGEDWDMLGKLRDNLRTVLSTREHVPNKVEAKLIRQRKAKAGRNFCSHH